MKIKGCVISFRSTESAAIKHKFIGLPVKIFTFHAKNTPVHWGKIYPIKQEYSLVRRKKFIGMKTEICTDQSHLHCIGQSKEKSRKPIAAQSEIGNLGRLQLKLQFVSNQGDELRIEKITIGSKLRFYRENGIGKIAIYYHVYGVNVLVFIKLFVL